LRLRDLSDGLEAVGGDDVPVSTSMPTLRRKVASRRNLPHPTPANLLDQVLAGRVVPAVN
jgi:hypothetical protein